MNRTNCTTMLSIPSSKSDQRMDMQMFATAGKAMPRPRQRGASLPHQDLLLSVPSAEGHHQEVAGRASTRACLRRTITQQRPVQTFSSTVLQIGVVTFVAVQTEQRLPKLPSERSLRSVREVMSKHQISRACAFGPLEPTVACQTRPGGSSRV